MAQGEESEKGETTQFKITTYHDGYFEPNGDRTDVPFEADQLKDWERFNETTLDGKGFGKGQKLTLPIGAQTGYKLIFGRQTQLCDVVVDTDITGNFARERVGCFKKAF